MDTKLNSDSDGKFIEEYRQTSRSCPRCGKKKSYIKIWESSCGGYQDNKIWCQACDHKWWVDGPDS